MPKQNISTFNPHHTNAVSGKLHITSYSQTVTPHMFTQHHTTPHHHMTPNTTTYRTSYMITSSWHTLTWKASDLRGTMNLSGSTELPVSLRATAVSHLSTLHARFGKKVTPFAATVERYLHDGGGGGWWGEGVVVTREHSDSFLCLIWLLHEHAFISSNVHDKKVRQTSVARATFQMLPMLPSASSQVHNKKT